jgi:hypothetical protein
MLVRTLNKYLPTYFNNNVSLERDLKYNFRLGDTVDYAIEKLRKPTNKDRRPTDPIVATFFGARVYVPTGIHIKVCDDAMV